MWFTRLIVIVIFGIPFKLRGRSRPLQCINFSCHHVYAHCTTICVDCLVLFGVCFFSLERDSRSRRARCGELQHRRPTLEYGSISQRPCFPRSSIPLDCQPKARDNLTFLAYSVVFFINLFYPP